MKNIKKQQTRAQILQEMQQQITDDREQYPQIRGPVLGLSIPWVDACGKALLPISVRYENKKGFSTEGMVWITPKYDPWTGAKIEQDKETQEPS